MKTGILFFAAAAIILSGCKKEKKNDVVKNNLTSKVWRPSGMRMNWDPYPLNDCERDNSFAFFQDNSVTENYGLLQCVPGQVASITYKYQITNGGKQITFVANGGSKKWEIRECSNNRLVVNYFQGMNLVECTFIPQ